MAGITATVHEGWVTREIIEVARAGSSWRTIPDKISAVTDVPDPVPETPRPSPEQVRLIREVIDPRRILLGG